MHDAITYEYGVTTVATTAAEALAGGRGVCQDSAHVMIALCRAAGLPARYVSGHLLGEGGTHAWVEVVVADRRGARAVAFDPCNGRRAGRAYLTVATGRDYADVAPTSGTYVGAGGRHADRDQAGRRHAALTGLAFEELLQRPVVRHDGGDLDVLVRAVLPGAADAERDRGDAARGVEAPVAGAVLVQEVGRVALTPARPGAAAWISGRSWSAWCGGSRWSTATVTPGSQNVRR